MGKLRRLAGLICILPAWAGAAPFAYVPPKTSVPVKEIPTSKLPWGVVLR